MDTDKNIESPYCKICSACGEYGCCSPLSCQQHPVGEYCGRYLTDLKFGYDFHQKICEYLCSITKENNDKFYEVFDLLYEKYYNKSLTP